uniref:F-box/LRR-repeat protein 12 n=1 Tax=Macrostomum lignano TaxID=282301 RepID=A0A1I8H9C8_9PLAT
RCPGLLELSITDCQKSLSAASLSSLLSGCPRLSLLEILGSATDAFADWQDRSVRQLFELPRVLSIAPNLTELRVTSCGNTFDLEPDRHPAPVPGLRHLSLDCEGSRDENTEIALWLLPSLPSLESLRLVSYQASEKHFRQILRCLPAGLADLKLRFTEIGARSELGRAVRCR